MNKQVTVLLLAGGASSRFWPLPHKMTVSFLGKTFLEHQIAFLKKLGVEDIVVVVHPSIAGQIAGEDITVEVQRGAGQKAAVLSAQEYIKNKPLLILNADDVVDAQLVTDILTFDHLTHHYLVGRQVEDYFPGGYLELDGKFVKRVVEKPGIGKTPSNYTRLVCDLFVNGRQFVEYLNANKTRGDDAYEQTLSHMMTIGERFEMIPYSGTWVPVKYPWHLLDIMQFYLGHSTASHIDPTAVVHETAQISGNVILEKNVRVLEYAKLVGPLYVGAGSIIGNHTLVRDSHIGESAVIGFNSDVTRSYIGNNCWLHSNYVGDSILADGVAMGAGATLANLRLDEATITSFIGKEKTNTGRTKLGGIFGENVRVGVGVHIMPGVKIGPSTMIGAGVLLQHDIEGAKLIYAKQTHMIANNIKALKNNRDTFRKGI